MTTRTPGSADDPEPTLAYSQPRPMPYGSSPYAVTVGPDAATHRRRPGVRLRAGGRLDRAARHSRRQSCSASLAGLVVVVDRAPAARARVGQRRQERSVRFVKQGVRRRRRDVSCSSGSVAGLLCGVVATISGPPPRRRREHRDGDRRHARVRARRRASVGQISAVDRTAHWLAHAGVGRHHYFIELTTGSSWSAWPMAALVVDLRGGLVHP